ncbi:haloacid dehalogenaselike hydrolase domain containing protein [Acanthamoeba castellanii str. Neff]|uniref:Haloacid dehalogenaselike hydrolase domain containing protein n=1 Tax=Acanthamoeba castellanii (strain ATCC 30010 / Neff) TaxID=1257118 RepID=L8GGS7_ACACF|nr:haloacid dehalogenaselike hydrolase domain containing protein [Acanthamoeba castellanii str. Neff]ELR11953.1 haloacid dehalogenaselike hydrolase domain containing protein [Acanthamoeba castellanii str. Neff]
MLARGWRGLRLGAVVLDVDGTLTRKDTIEDVIAAAIDGASRCYSAATQQRRDEQGEGRARPGDEEDAVGQSKRHVWAGLKEAYAGPYGTFLDHLLPPQRSHRTASLLQHHLLEEERVEYESVRRVEAAGLLAGLSTEQWRELGRSMARSDLLHTGAVECIRRLREEAAANTDCEGGLALHALSANWSKDYLAGALDGLIDEQHIRTNEVNPMDLAYDEVTKLSTGQMKLQVVSALDKQRYIRCLREELHNRPNNRVLYVGDSLNDILALLEADYGVLMGSRKTAAEVLRAYNVEVRPLASFETKFAQEPNAQGPVVWQANDWGEVVSWLFPSDENRK